VEKGSNVGNSLVEHFQHVNDPRVNRRKLHYLMDIIVIAVMAVICDSQGWEDIEEFAIIRKEWLKTFLRLPNGIPSHDTFRRVISRLNPDELQQCFSKWIQSVCTAFENDVIAIDGKTLRSSFERGAREEKAAIHMVSAWSSKAKLVLGQVKTAEKSNEITAIPDLLKLLELKGCIVTIDAMGCQKTIAQSIVAKGGDYILALKGNQGDVHRGAQIAFDIADSKQFEGLLYDRYEEVSSEHGRIETRRYETLGVSDWFPYADEWPLLKTLVKVVSTREIQDSVNTEVRYYISSLELGAKSVGEAIRKHWGIENSLHWVLDVTFREDESRIRRGDGAENFSTLRRIALTMLKREPTKKSIARKRKLCSWSPEFLIGVMIA
jgi:predicted transposase YbfD/YdcC